jgi:hypothetical protein
MRNRLLPLVPLLCCTAAALRAQPLVQTIAPFAVERNGDGERYINPFSGGLVQPRINLRDADGDGLPDLFTLNTDNRLRYYHNEGGLRFRRVFPTPYDSAAVRSWFRLEDIDADGDLDLFTSGEHSELLLYRNGASSAAPSFPAIPDTLRRADTSAIIFTQQETVPSLVDIDADGDLDLFAGDPVGTITFFRNRGSAQSPQFVLESRKYMDILVLSPATTRKKDEPAIQRHGASVLDFADIDGDGDLDMLFGDFFTRKLLLFHNDGSRQQAAFSMNRIDTAFEPTGDVVESAGFNQPVAGDIDGDGDLDVLVSSLYLDAFDQPVILYENVAGTGAPVMRRRATDVTSEIDIGTYAAPTEIHDGSHDGVLAGTSDGSVIYFAVSAADRATTWRQTSTLRTNVPGLFNPVPTAGDLDGDGSAEVVIGDADGRVHLFRFRGTTRLDSVPWQLDTVKVNAYATPTLIDFDGDGDLDLFIGAGNGRFIYFRNVGSAASPRFERAAPPPPFDTIDLGLNSILRFGDIDGDGDLDAIAGCWPSPDRQRGIVRIYLNHGGAFATSPLYPDISTDPDPIPMAMRLDEGEFLFVGDRAGGMLAFVDTRLASGVPAESPDRSVESGSLEAFPTLLGPTGGSVTVRWNLSSPPSSLVLSDRLGRVMMRTRLTARAGSMSVMMPEMTPGLYFLAIEGAPARKIIVTP